MRNTNFSQRMIFFLDDDTPALKCSKCGEIFPFEKFGLDKRHTTGRQARCRECANKYHVRTKEDIRNHNLKHNYGISLDECAKLHEKQNGKCLICHLHKKTLFVDHDHKTNKIRGLLCGNCNVGIGNLKDDIEILKSAIRYLESYK